jgi:hypothetical protein
MARTSAKISGYLPESAAANRTDTVLLNILFEIVPNTVPSLVDDVVDICYDRICKLRWDDEQFSFEA